MKTKVHLTVCAVLLMALSACSSDNEVNESIATTEMGGVIYSDGQQATNMDNPIAQFFATELRMPYWDNEGNSHTTFFEHGEWNSEECLLINSHEEFQAAYKGTKQLPDIDFSKYTLIIGRTWGEDSSVWLDHIELKDLGKMYQMEVFVSKTPGIALTVITHIMYWQLYPKMSSKPITTKRTHQDAVPANLTITLDNIMRSTAASFRLA